MATETMKPSELLQCAVDLFKSSEVEWIQGKYFDWAFTAGRRRLNHKVPVTECCGLGAIRVCAGSRQDPASMFSIDTDAAGQELNIFTVSHYPTLKGFTEWQDAPGRKKEEVISLMEQVAEQARKEGR